MGEDRDGGEGGEREVVEKIRLPHFELNPKKQFENMCTATHRDREKERGGAERERERCF